MINGQAITSGGAVVTFLGTNDVATLCSEGLVVQYSGGSISTFAVQTFSPEAIQGAATVTGYGILQFLYSLLALSKIIALKL